MKKKKQTQRKHRMLYVWLYVLNASQKINKKKTLQDSKQ